MARRRTVKKWVLREDWRNSKGEFSRSLYWSSFSGLDTCRQWVQVFYNFAAQLFAFLDTCLCHLCVLKKSENGVMDRMKSLRKSELSKVYYREWKQKMRYWIVHAMIQCVYVSGFAPEIVGRLCTRKWHRVHIVCLYMLCNWEITIGERLKIDGIVSRCGDVCLF